MTAHDEDDDSTGKLARLVGRVLRDLPQRHAPASLEGRISREILRRSARPWWHRSFAEWSLPVRAGFIAACGGVIALTVTLTGHGGPADPPVAKFLGAWVLDRTHAASILASADGAAALLGRLVPVEWLRIGLGMGAAFYGVLFGLGAAAYRTLFLEPGEGG